jgi:hypothetical protein
MTAKRPPSETMAGVIFCGFLKEVMDSRLHGNDERVRQPVVVIGHGFPPSRE